MDQHILKTLVQNACPSIAYRIKREILKEDIHSPDMMALQEAILRDPQVMRILALAQEDGWLGGTFHGRDEPESGIRYLMEKAVEGSHPVVRGALTAIENRGVAFDKGSMERVGKPLDDWRLGGSKLMRACVFAYAGAEEHEFVRQGILEALEVFRSVLTVRSAEDISMPYKGKLVFRKGALWPCIYHLRLLAHTQNWRTEDNLNMLAQAVTRLGELSPIPEIKLLHKGQIISPASVYMNDFKEDLAGLDSAGWAKWFHRAEMIARLNIAAKVPAVMRQLQYVSGLVKEGGGLFTKELRHPYFTEWSQYMGLALENDWKTKNRRVYDLTFRWLLIQTYAGIE